VDNKEEMEKLGIKRRKTKSGQGGGSRIPSPHDVAETWRRSTGEALDSSGWAATLCSKMPNTLIILLVPQGTSTSMIPVLLGSVALDALSVLQQNSSACAVLTDARLVAECEQHIHNAAPIHSGCMFRQNSIVKAVQHWPFPSMAMWLQSDEIHHAVSKPEFRVADYMAPLYQTLQSELQNVEELFKTAHKALEERRQTPSQRASNQPAVTLQVCCTGDGCHDGDAVDLDIDVNADYDDADPSPAHGTIHHQASQAPAAQPHTQAISSVVNAVPGTAAHFMALLRQYHALVYVGSTCIHPAYDKRRNTLDWCNPVHTTCLDVGGTKRFSCQCRTWVTTQDCFCCAVVFPRTNEFVQEDEYTWTGEVVWTFSNSACDKYYWSFPKEPHHSIGLTALVRDRVFVSLPKTVARLQPQHPPPQVRLEKVSLFPGTPSLRTFHPAPLLFLFFFFRFVFVVVCPSAVQLQWYQLSPAAATSKAKEIAVLSTHCPCSQARGMGHRVPGVVGRRII
jgi:hypothetical protein